MQVRVIDTTDGQFLGEEFDSEDRPIVFDDDVQFYPDRVIPIPGGLRFASSNYIIDTREV